MSSGKVKGEDLGISGHHKLERCLRMHYGFSDVPAGIFASSHLEPFVQKIT